MASSEKYWPWWTYLLVSVASIAAWTFVDHFRVWRFISGLFSMLNGLNAGICLCRENDKSSLDKGEK
jgi:hypothetical protein